MTLGENGIFKKAQEAKRLQTIATAKEQIGLEILEAQIEAMENNEELEQSEVETIVAKYGTLQADGDIIILNDNGYEVSLREIYNEMAEVESDGDSTTELAQLKALLSQTTVTEDKILKDYKAYKDGQLITGTMENYAGQTVSTTQVTESGENALITIPENGYYSTDSKISIPVSEINSNLNKIKYKLFQFSCAHNGTHCKPQSVTADEEIGCISYIYSGNNGVGAMFDNPLVLNGATLNFATHSNSTSELASEILYIPKANLPKSAYEIQRTIDITGGSAYSVTKTVETDFPHGVLGITKIEVSSQYVQVGCRNAQLINGIIDGLNTVSVTAFARDGGVKTGTATITILGY